MDEDQDRMMAPPEVEVEETVEQQEEEASPEQEEPLAENHDPDIDMGASPDAGTPAREGQCADYLPRI